MKCGLSAGYPDEKQVYYEDGAWHGYSGDLQPSSKEHYLVCTVHNAESYAASQVPETPTEGEGTEGGEQVTEPVDPAAAE